MNNNLSRQSLSPAALSNQKNGRIFSLDLLKAISITAVVSYHSLLVPKETYSPDFFLPLEIIFSPLRFCVPVFLTISFLLFERGLAKSTDSIGPAIKKRLVRLLIPTGFWFGIMTLLKLLAGNPWWEVIGNIPKGEIFTGAYYLLVLLQFIPIFIIFRHWFGKPINILATILLQGIIFLCIYAIPSSSFHDQILSTLKTIDRPLFIYWFVYMAIGAYICNNWQHLVKLSARINIKIKANLLILYCLIQAVESYYFYNLFNHQLRPFEYIRFSCILSVFVVFIAFISVQEKDLNSWIGKLVSTLSKYSLGIFCINGVLYHPALSVSQRLFSEATFSLSEILIIKLICWIGLLAVSLGLSKLLDRVGLGAVVR